MTKVRNKRDNACKVLSKHLAQSQQGVDRELGTCPRWTNRKWRCSIGPCTLIPTWPSWAQSVLHHQQKDPGLFPGPWRVGKKLFIQASGSDSSSCVGVMGWGWGWTQPFRRLPCILLLGKAGEVPTLSLLGSPPSTNRQKSKQSQLLQNKNQSFCQINSSFFWFVCVLNSQDTLFLCTAFNKGKHKQRQPP